MTDEQRVGGRTDMKSGSFWLRLKRNPWFWSAVGGIVFLTAIRPLMRHVPEPPPILSTLPDFALVDQSGQMFGSSDLRGHVYVVSFFFTTCRSICPALIRSVRELNHRYESIGADIKIVSFTVDPDHDSPKVLEQYANDMEIDTKRWTLLTGEKKSIENLLIKGFRVDMGEKAYVSDSLVDIAHSSKIVLVDKNGNVRGYYGTDSAGIDEVFHRSLHVAGERD
ncbi:MAG: SCO family protein [Myxococcales bacterium]|nr:SCO family protein [Myxococcales bacterium]